MMLNWVDSISAPVWRRLFLLALAGVLVLLLVPTPETPASVSAIPHLDKVVHVLLFAGLAVLGLFAWPDQRLWVVVGLIGFGVLTECLQGMTGWRTFSVWDMVADAVGVGLGWRLRRLLLVFSR